MQCENRSAWTSQKQGAYSVLIDAVEPNPLLPKLSIKQIFPKREKKRTRNKSSKETVKCRGSNRSEIVMAQNQDSSEGREQKHHTEYRENIIFPTEFY